MSYKPTSNSTYSGTSQQLPVTVSGHRQHADSHPTIINPFHLDDNKLLNHIYGYYVHSADRKPLDLESLFGLVQSILKHSIQVVENIVGGRVQTKELIDDRLPPSSFTSPYCTLKEISSEISCKPLKETIAHKSATSILEKLKNYSWDEKAVLTLGAFAMDYGEFALLAEVQTSDQLANLLARLTQISKITFIKKLSTTTTTSTVATGSPQVLNERDVIIQVLQEVNSLIKLILQVVELIHDLEKLSKTYDPKVVTHLQKAQGEIPVDVYWAIITIVVSATQVNCLTCDGGYKQELSIYRQRLSNILNRLNSLRGLSQKNIEEINAYNRIKNIVSKPTEIAQVLRVLLFPEEDKRPQFYDGSAKELVDIDRAVRTKDALIFISTLDDIDDEILCLQAVYDDLKKTKNDNQYKILWVPIVDQWNETQRQKFENSRSKMPWYVVNYFSYKPGQKYIKDDWLFDRNPIVVVMNPKGIVVNPDAMHLIRLWGRKGFPFDEKRASALIREGNWIEPVLSKVDPVIKNSIKAGSYILLFGGLDSDWNQRFHNSITKLRDDPIIKEDPIIKDEKITVEPFYVGGSSPAFPDPLITNRFWLDIENLFVNKIYQKEVDPQGTNEVQKLLTYRSEHPGWAVLSKGPNVKVIGHGTTVTKVLEDFPKWKRSIPSKGFERTFIEIYNQKIPEDHRCSQLYITNIDRKLPDIIKCETCQLPMQVYKLYQCCHGHEAADGNVAVDSHA
ncbi:Protein SIEVE ELEMENT OCCLUSION B [Quillaja saponaria]|uniref:Protein SIEVE ELEMENT OCCLUSION B n=1 Tax=Quillaja saponaria TaxID=32244 RepID=A0AAD7LB19_QUISA|nr:Protein SIEVE ELEMENT OCCLUSION B [Quillaja saponaria]